MRYYLVVHEVSLPYIRRTVDFLHSQLSQCCDEVTLLSVAGSVDEAVIDGPATVFVIGERLPPFTRRPGCFYVYFNFSVVAVIGNPLHMSLKGAKQIWTKRRLLGQKMAQADVIFDYYPAQTRILQKRLPKPVFGFLPCSARPDAAEIPMADRAYDLCFVGGVTPRRQRVLDQAEAAGLRLSPARGHDLEDLTAQSRCTLNIHMQVSNHLEIPRIVGSLSTSTPVVTEHSHGLAEIVDSPSVQPGRAQDLIPMAQDLLADSAALETLRQRAHEAYDSYHQRASAALATSCREVQRMAAL